MDNVSDVIEIKDDSVARRLFGPTDKFLKIIEIQSKVYLTARGNQLKIVGSLEAVHAVKETLGFLMQQCETRDIGEDDVYQALAMIKIGVKKEQAQKMGETLLITYKGKPVRAKTLGQQVYIDHILNHTITFGIGPAGTGKTYLAVVMAVRALKRHEISRIVLTRPAVEAGEKLGFLPGDMQEKVDPYLRPLYDGLYDSLGQEVANRYLEKGIIEVAPLAYMRGRTLEDSFIIFDEAQNSTSEQMKMFLTRIGFGSRVVVTGDITQIDLPNKKASGLLAARRILEGIDEIAFLHLQAEDVVRHPVVAKIIRAYDVNGTIGETNHG